MSASDELRRAGAELAEIAETPGRWFTHDRLGYLAAVIAATAERVAALERTAFGNASERTAFGKTSERTAFGGCDERNGMAIAHRPLLATTADGKVIVGPWRLQ